MQQIEAVLEYLREFNIASVAVRLTLSVILGGLIGMERGRRGRAAGLRTHILVCLGAAMASLLGVFVTKELEIASDASRIAAQVISGIGFLGAGTIVIKGRFRVSGLTTAAGLWATASIGLALGYAFFEGALIAAFLTVVTITILSHFEARIYRRNARASIYIELGTVTAVNATSAMLAKEYRAIDLQVTPPRSGIQNHVGFEATVYLGYLKISEEELIRQISEKPDVIFVLESV
jgi:putative Mg2+ transporter-C (MgtC) family protein